MRSFLLYDSIRLWGVSGTSAYTGKRLALRGEEEDVEAQWEEKENREFDTDETKMEVPPFAVARGVFGYLKQDGANPTRLGRTSHADDRSRVIQ